MHSRAIDPRIFQKVDSEDFMSYTSLAACCCEFRLCEMLNSLRASIVWVKHARSFPSLHLSVDIRLQHVFVSDIHSCVDESQ